MKRRFTLLKLIAINFMILPVGCAEKKPIRRMEEGNNAMIETKNIQNKSRIEYEGYINNLETFPASFIYGNAGYRGFRSDLFSVVSSTKSVNGVKEHHIIKMRMSDGMLVTLDTTYYEGYDAFDWTISFENDGESNSKVLKNFNAADYNIPGKNALIRGVLGDHENQYACYNFDLTKKDFLDENVIGRSTHITFPYYDLENDDGGAMIAIGWPGTYRAKFMYDERTQSTNFIGQGCLNLETYLKPGEKVMSPLMVVVRYYEKNEYTAINAWRRWYVDCHAPAANGNGDKFTPIEGVMLKRDVQLGPTNDATSETSETWRRSFDAVIDHNVDFQFRLIDACWYNTPSGGSTTTDWWSYVGTWEVDENKWPDNSFKETVDFGLEHGAFTQLWFESERVTQLDDLERNHGFRRKWALSDHGNNNLNFVNLADEEAYQWLRNKVLTTIRKYKIGLYREDFNAEPAASWTIKDHFIGPHRIGITENIYTQNHFRLWEEVIALQVALGGCNYIDDCASGGGRNDILSLRYSYPFNRSDADWAMVYPHSMPLRLAFSHATFKWLPIAGVYVNEMADGQLGMYNLRASYAPIMTYACQFYHNTKLDWDNLLAAQQEWKGINKYLTKDYYPLTPYHKVSDDKTWDVFQFMDPKTGEGIIQGFRKEHCESRVCEVKVQGLDNDAYYQISDPDGLNVLAKVKGAALAKGYSIILENPASACLLYINKLSD